ncbi:MAG: hypothetical protein HY319_32805 [Armatimonadetes bacterium]|nr:hypothetical protein [Armatimonadota bacterium]
MSYRFSLAGSQDDGEIRRLLAESPVAGPVELTFEREPSFLESCRVHGPFVQVLVGRNPEGLLSAVASRSIRSHFVNGIPRAYGYLSGLRVARSQRGQWLLSGGFRYLRELHGDGRVPGYITTITEGNQTAEGVLVRRARRGFPRYRELARVCTLSLAVRRLRSPARPAARADLGEIVDFLRREGARKQFFPVWSEADFLEEGTTPGFRPEDFLVLREGGRITAVAGLWDQSSFKQTVVQRYNGVMRLGRRLAGLPPPGSPLPIVYGCFVCIEENRPERFRPLLEGLLGRAREGGHRFVVVGFAEGDPLLELARRYRHADYYSRLYEVRWKEAGHEDIDHRIPYVEIACL